MDDSLNIGQQLIKPGSLVLGRGKATTLDQSSYQGLTWNPTADTYTRTGTIAAIPISQSAGNANLPIQGLMRRCLLLDNGTVNYYLSPTDSTKKADGTAANLTGADGQVMVEIPKFYFQQGIEAGVKFWKISKFPLTGFAVHPAFVKDNVEVDYRYYSAYEGSMFDSSTAAMCAKASIATNLYAAGDKMCSVSGQWPKIGETRAEYRTMSAQRGAGWRQLDYYLHSAVQLLYLVEYANFNSQVMIGAGRTNISGGTWVADSYIGATGLSNSLGNASGSVHLGGTAGFLTDFMSYRGIENFFGNVWKMVDGWTIDGRWTGAPVAMPMYATNDSSKFANDTDMGVAKLIDASYIGSPANYIADIENCVGFIPSVGGGSTTVKVTDYYYQYSAVGNNFWRVPLVGGYAAAGGSAGVFALLASYAWSFGSVYIGGRLCF